MHGDKIDLPEAVIFDLDGTLLDTIGDIARALNTVLGRHGFAVAPVEAYRTRIGWGVMETVRRSLGAEAAEDTALVRSISRQCREYMNDHPADLSSVFDGVSAILEELQRQDVSLYVLTNKPDDVARKVVSTMFPSIHFAGVSGQRDDLPAKPDPAGVHALLSGGKVAAERSYFVGDTVIDMQTARNAGCVAVAVLWGYGDRGEIEESSPDYLCYSVDELRQILCILPKENDDESERG